MNNHREESAIQSKEDDQELISYKYLLGEMGIQMLSAIFRGANTKEAIMMLSGVPMSCINGRMPVLLNLNLVTQNNAEFFITEYGHKFLILIEQA